MSSRLVALSVLLVGIALARVAPPYVAVAAVALPLLGVLTGPRFRLDPIGQAALSIGAMLVGVLVPRLLVSPEVFAHDDPGLLSERTLLLAVPLLVVAAARTLVDAPLFGPRLTLAAALLALAAAGRAQSVPSVQTLQTAFASLGYPALAGLALVAGFAALHASDPARPKLGLLGPRHLAALALSAAVAGGLTVASAWGMPRLRDAVLAQLMGRWKQSRTGFSDQMFLGDMAGMLQSDVTVMRLRGGAPPLVRGTVYTTYAGGRWETDGDLSAIEVVETPVEPAHPHPAALVEIENAGRPARYFVPLGARDVVVATGIYERDQLGIYSPSLRLEAKRVWFTEGGGREPLGARSGDRQVPSRVKPALLEILGAWRVDQADPRARVEAIAARLQADYRYSLSFERRRGVDPVVSFLTTDREGHCEYFASALALLARAADVPARLVAGYRVVETSPLGYHVVRERHAHSWVEVWLDDHWITIDPTPAADLAASSPATTPLFGALTDGIATAWEKVDDWIGQRSAFELSLMLVGLVALLIGARVLRGRADRARVVAIGDLPLPGFEALARALARRGVDRTPPETLSRFAQRIELEARLSASLKARAAALVRRYELVRYGGRGDAGALDRELSEAARAVSSRASDRTR